MYDLYDLKNLLDFDAILLSFISSFSFFSILIVNGTIKCLLLLREEGDFKLSDEINKMKKLKAPPEHLHGTLSRFGKDNLEIQKWSMKIDRRCMTSSNIKISNGSHFSIKEVATPKRPRRAILVLCILTW